MAPIRTLVATLLLIGTSLGRNVPQADNQLVKRDAVGACETVLIALKASSFCSSFVPITDSTVTTTTTAPTTTTTTTITLPDCYTTVATTTFINVATLTETDTAIVTVTSAGNPPDRKRAVSTTTSTKSTASVQSTSQATTQAVTKATTATTASSVGGTATTSATVTAATCTIKGLPIALNMFSCDVIKQACLSYVKPKTSTFTSTVTPTSTASVSTQPPCIPVTASTTASVTTVVTTTETSTSVSYAPTPSCNGNYVYSSTGTQFCQFFQGYQQRNSYAFYTTQFYPAGTADSDAIQQCANFVGSNSAAALTFQVFYVPSEGRWHCDTSLASNCDSQFNSNAYVNQIYQYNVVGSTCDS